MSATKPGRGLASPDSRRRRGNRRPTSQRVPLFDTEAGHAPGSPADGTRQVPDPIPAPMADTDPLQSDNPPETWWESLQRAQRARAGRLRSLWQMSAAERVAAMRRGDLTYEQLAAWSARHPEQVPTVHGEFEWIVAKLPEVCE
jgi:hypothetical protein